MSSSIRPVRRPLLRPLIFLALGALVPLGAAPTADELVTDMKRAADWQLANPSTHKIHDWTQAPFFMGLLHLNQVSGDAKYLEAADGFGKQLQYGPGPRVTHADDHAVLQAWLDLYDRDKDQAKLQPAIDRFGEVAAAVADHKPASVSGGTFTWWWCDALFMSPPVWAHLSHITGDPKYLAWADREWWTTTDVLFDPTHHLYYRDNRFFDRRMPSGHKVFWSRGNGWVVGGTVHMLDYLPADHPSREKYLGLYHDMMHALLKLQNADGLWRTSLLDSDDETGESSGSAFFVYAMAWGLNRGLLPEDAFRPAVEKGIEALVKNIQPDGMLGFVQRIDDGPRPASASSTEVYGTGAFLMAGSEVVRMLNPEKRRSGLASFGGVKLPDRFMPATPRAVARFVPERSDDFAWENDKVAFRTYGPALRDSVENSGIDCWFKRVPYPVMTKWYIEDRTRLPNGNVSKPYHEDQGEGYDIYKVGDTRGCGGISAWAEGKMHNSNTFVAHRIVEDTPERVAFELDYASDFQGKTLRETKRITLIMGEHLFQCDSRFTLDGEPAADLDVAIGLRPQVDGTAATNAPAAGTMQLWETVDDLGVGTAIVLDPARVVKMQAFTDEAGQTQAVTLARTDDAGAIRWFAGFGWEGQGDIETAAEWTAYLKKFAAKYLAQPYANPQIHVHELPVPQP